MGTFVLMLLGNGVVAGVLLKKTKAEGAGWMVITTAWAFAVLCGIFTAQLFGSPDAHLNPAFTFAFAIKGHEYSKMLPFAAAQLSGGLSGCDSNVALLSAALARDARCVDEAGCLRDGPSYPLVWVESVL